MVWVHLFPEMKDSVQKVVLNDHLYPIMTSYLKALCCFYYSLKKKKHLRTRLIHLASILIQNGSQMKLRKSFHNLLSHYGKNAQMAPT